MRRRGVAAHQPTLDAVDDGGEAEHHEHHQIVEVGELVAAGATAVGGDVFLFRWDAERGKVEPGDAGEDCRRHAVHHEVVDEVGDGIAERRQFPVEDGADLRLGGVEDHVVAAIVAVEHARFAAVGGEVLAEPVDHAVHRGDAAGLGIAEILLRPAADLAFDEARRATVIGEANRSRVDAVQLGDGGVHRVEVGGAGGGGEAGEPCVPDDAAVDHVHDEKGGAEDALVLAQRVDARDGETGRAERGHDAMLALDGVGALEEGAGGFAAQDIGSARCVELVGRVRLAAGELADGEGAREVGDVGGHPCGERGLVEAQPIADVAGAAVGLGPVHRTVLAAPPDRAS